MQCLNLQQALFLARNASLTSMKTKKPKLCSGRTTPSRSWNQCSSLVKNNHLSKETVSSLFVTAQLCEDITRKAEIGSLCLFHVTPESSKHKKGETLNNAFCKTMAKEIVRKEPDKKYLGQPCSVTCVGTAYDHIHTWPFTIIKPEGMRYDGYLRLRDMNQFAREYLPIAKRIDFKKNERPRLKDFLQTNETRCCICVLGHYLYADTQTYWSFFDNDDDKVIAVWYLRVPSTENTTRKASQKHLDSDRKD